MNKSLSEKEKYFEKQVEEIKKIRIEFENKNMRGSLAHYLELNGGITGATDKFKTITGFISALEKAGYSRQYIRDLKIKWKVYTHGYRRNRT